MVLSSILTDAFLFLALYIEVFLLIGFVSKGVWTSTRSTQPPHERITPNVAIFVPCYNEAETVEGTINSLLSFEYPKDKLSIIVVDDGSTDATLARARAAAIDPRITVLHKENGGKHSALNMALAHTNAEIIGCLDADSFAAPDALIKSVQAFTDPHVGATTPAILVHEPKNLLQMMQRAEYALSVFLRKAFADSDAILVTPGPLSLFRRQVIEKAGGWSHGHGTEDLEMTLKLREQGVRITNDPTVSVYTKTPSTLRALYKQRVRWTYGFLMNMVDFRHMIFNRKYGAVGLVVLPGGIISIFGVVFLTLSALVSTLHNLYSTLDRYITVGIHFSMPHFDIFFVNTSITILMMYIMLMVTISLMSIGKRLSGQKIISWDMPLYLCIYGLIAPLWLFGAVAHAALGAQAKWR